MPETVKKPTSYADTCVICGKKCDPRAAMCEPPCRPPVIRQGSRAPYRAFFVLAATVMAGCAPSMCTAVRMEGVPTDTVFYAEVRSASPVAFYTNDAWVWPFEAQESVAPGNFIRGFSDCRLQKGEAVIGEQQGRDRKGRTVWGISRRVRK